MAPFSSVACLAVVLSTAVSADKVYVTDDNDVDPSYQSLYEIDTVTQTVTNVANWTSAVTAPLPFVYGATVCGSNYYGQWADIAPMGFGIVKVDLTGKKDVEITSTPVLYHALACDPQNSSRLLAVGSVPGQNAAAFTLRRATQSDKSTFSDVVIAEIPMEGFIGYDAAFTFNEAGTELFAGSGTRGDTLSMQQGNARPALRRQGGVEKGYLSILDTATGKVKTNASLTPGNLPYAVLPDTKPLQGMVMTGGFENPHYSWAEFELEASSVRVKRGASADNFYNENHMPVCGGTMYTTVNTLFTLLGVDAQTGKIKTTIDISSKMPSAGQHALAGLACVSSK